MQKEKIIQKQDERDPGLFAMIPVIILERKDIKPTAKLLYAEITSLAYKTGECFATNKYLGKMLGLSETSISDILLFLKKKELINIKVDRRKEGTYRTIKLNMGILMGTPESQTTLPPESNNSPPGESNNSPTIDNNNVDNNKDNTLRVEETSSSGKIVNELIFLFKSVNPFYENFFSRETQRQSVERLLKKLGRQKLENAIKTLEKTNKEQYAPVITTPLQLEEKLGSLIAFVQKQIKKTSNVMVI